MPFGGGCCPCFCCCCATGGPMGGGIPDPTTCAGCCCIGGPGMPPCGPAGTLAGGGPRFGWTPFMCRLYIPEGCMWWWTPCRTRRPEYCQTRALDAKEVQHHPSMREAVSENSRVSSGLPARLLLIGLNSSRKLTPGTRRGGLMKNGFRTTGWR